MKALYDSASVQCSKVVTNRYSTSFSLGILCLHRAIRNPIYSLYGFVRVADEIVDSFHEYNKEALLADFKAETYKAIDQNISTNPILHSFQETVHQYSIERSLVEQFFQSMEMDLSQKTYTKETFKTYILGSAEVVGLMCLRVFCKNDGALYEHLKPFAMSLGSAFQKINFLRDLHADFVGMGRSYFPEVDLENFTEQSKNAIIQSIRTDFDHALIGIKQLPKSSRFGVYVAYVYYTSLFKKIKNTASECILKNRIRIKNSEKATLLAYSYVKHQLNLL
jgi:phytoene synthase